MKIRVRQSFVRGEMNTPKSRKSVRAIPLASRLVSELEEHHMRTPYNQDGDLVLCHPHTGRPLDEKNLMLRFKAALDRAGVRHVRIHDLRHTFATTVAASGQVPIRTLQEWLGHELLSTTLIYADYMPGHNEVQMLDAAFGALPDGQLVANDTHIAPHQAIESPETAP
jgi:integrase